MSTFQNRNRPEYMRALGFSLLRVCRCVPGGILCFFASYSQLHACLQEWKKKKKKTESSSPPSFTSSSSSRGNAWSTTRSLPGTPSLSSSSSSVSSAQGSVFLSSRPAAALRGGSSSSFFGFRAAPTKRAERSSSTARTSQGTHPHRREDDVQHKEMMEVGDKDEEQQDSSSLFAELEKTKKVFVEPATSRDMADLLLSFQQAVEDAYRGKEKKAEGQSGWRGGWEEIEGRDKSSRTVTGAILLAVCKGKAAEGIDFSDHFCRAVVICGLPLASFFDPRIQLKRTWLDDRLLTQNTLLHHELQSAQKLAAHQAPDTKTPAGSSGSSGGGAGPLVVSPAPPASSPMGVFLSGKQWYEQEARRAINQAIGRVLRHSKDFGVVVLMDKRFTLPDVQADLPKWIRRSLVLPPSLSSSSSSIATTAAASSSSSSPFSFSSSSTASSDPLSFITQRIHSFFRSLPPSLLECAGRKIARSLDLGQDPRFFSNSLLLSLPLLLPSDNEDAREDKMLKNQTTLVKEEKKEQKRRRGLVEDIAYKEEIGLREGSGLVEGGHKGSPRGRTRNESPGKTLLPASSVSSSLFFSSCKENTDPLDSFRKTRVEGREGDGERAGGGFFDSQDDGTLRREKFVADRDERRKEESKETSLSCSPSSSSFSRKPPPSSPSSSSSSASSSSHAPGRILADGRKRARDQEILSIGRQPFRVEDREDIRHGGGGDDGRARGGGRRRLSEREEKKKKLGASEKKKKTARQADCFLSLADICEASSSSTSSSMTLGRNRAAGKEEEEDRARRASLSMKLDEEEEEKRPSKKAAASRHLPEEGRRRLEHDRRQGLEGGGKPQKEEGEEGEEEKEELKPGETSQKTKKTEEAKGSLKKEEAHSLLLKVRHLLQNPPLYSSASSSSPCSSSSCSLSEGDRARQADGGGRFLRFCRLMKDLGNLGRTQKKKKISPPEDSDVEEAKYRLVFEGMRTLLLPSSLSSPPPLPPLQHAPPLSPPSSSPSSSSSRTVPMSTRTGTDAFENALSSRERDEKKEKKNAFSSVAEREDLDTRKNVLREIVLKFMPKIYHRSYLLSLDQHYDTLLDRLASSSSFSSPSSSSSSFSSSSSSLFSSEREKGGALGLQGEVPEEPSFGRERDVSEEENEEANANRRSTGKKEEDEELEERKVSVTPPAASATSSSSVLSTLFFRKKERKEEERKSLGTRASREKEENGEDEEGQGGVSWSSHLEKEAQSVSRSKGAEGRKKEEEEEEEEEKKKKKREEPKAEGKSFSGVCLSSDEENLPEEEEERQGERGEGEREKKRKMGLCLICTEDRKQLYRSLKCGHEFCQACWLAQLKRRLECPVCRERTREKHIGPA